MKKMNLNKRILVYILLVVFLRSTTIGCDCISTTEVFIDEVNKTPLVIHAKIIKQLKRGKDTFGVYDFQGITQIKVLHSFKGKLWTDTLVHINTDPTNCGISIQNLKENQEVFLKAYLSNDYNLEAYYFDNTASPPKSDILIYKLGKQFQKIEAFQCEPSIVPVINGMAIGRLNHNPSKQWRKYKRLQKSNPEKAKQYLNKHINSNNTYQ